MSQQQSDLFKINSVKFNHIFLACIILIVIAVGTVLILIGYQSRTVAALLSSDRHLMEILNAASRVSLLASQADAPGNNIFETLDLSLEKKNFLEAQGALADSIQHLEELIRSSSEKTTALPTHLLDPQEDIKKSQQGMASETSEIFRIFELSRLAQATVHMAKLDAHYRNLINASEKVRTIVTQAQLQNLAEHQTQLEREQRLEMGIYGALLIIGIGIGITYLGRRISVNLLTANQTTEEHRLILGLLNIGIWKYDPNSHALDWDSSMYKLFDLKESEFSGHYQAWESCLSQSEKEIAIEELQSALRGEKEFDTSFEIETSNQTRRIAGKGRVIRDSNGHATMMYGINYDITPEYNNQIEKERTHRLLTAVLQNIPSMIFVKNYKQNLQFSLLNKAGEDFLGVKEQDLIGKTDYDLFPQNQADFFVGKDRQLFVDRSAIRIDREEINTARGLKYITSYKVPTFDAQGEPDLLVGISDDITEDIQLRESLEVERSKSLYSAKLASLGEMAGGVAHEINNPLAIIKGRSSQMLRAVAAGDISNEKATEYLTLIVSTCDRISNIISGLRNFSRSGENDPFEIVEVSEMVSDTLVLCNEKFKTKEVSLELDLENGTKILGRSVQLSQVLLNLLSNSLYAVDQLTEKWVKLEVKSLSSDKIQIKVTDSGHGIPESTLKKLMQPFFTTKPVGEGTGLGLSLSKGIIENHGGRLYYSEENGHTQFVIELPTPPTSFQTQEAT